MPRLTSKRGRPSNYRRKLHSSYWEDVARRVRMRDRHRCRQCGSTVNLEVHHLTYRDSAGRSIVGREAEYMDKLITLCAECHQRIHNKR